MWMWLYIYALFLDVASANIVRFITETALIDFLFINPYTNSLALHWYIWNGSHSSSVIYPCILMAFVWLPNWYELILFWYNVITTNSIFCHPYYNSSTVTATGRPSFNTLRARQDGRHFPDDIFKRIFLNKNVWILIKISLKFILKGPIKNIPALVEIMAWRRPGNKPLSQPMMVSLLTHICVTRPQWVNQFPFWINNGFPGYHKSITCKL